MKLPPFLFVVAGLGFTTVQALAIQPRASLDSLAQHLDDLAVRDLYPELSKRNSGPATAFIRLPKRTNNNGRPITYNGYSMADTVHSSSQMDYHISQSRLHQKEANDASYRLQRAKQESNVLPDSFKSKTAGAMVSFHKGKQQTHSSSANYHNQQASKHETQINAHGINLSIAKTGR